MTPHAKKPLTISERFLSHVEHAGDCWCWTASRTFMLPSGSALAQKAAWEIFRGRVPATREVSKTCATKTCVNPAHLELLDRNLALARRAKAAHVRNGRGMRESVLECRVGGGA